MATKEALSFADFLTQRGVPLNGARVLDIGCFDGTMSEGLKERGAIVYGIDKDGKAIEHAIARGVYTADHAKACTVSELAQGNPFDTPFDLVICTGMTHMLSIQERIQLAHGIRQVLAPNGHAALVVSASTGALPTTSEEAGARTAALIAHTEAHNREVRGFSPSSRDGKQYKTLVKATRDIRSTRNEQIAALETHTKLIGCMLGKYFGKLEAFDIDETCFLASAPKNLAACPAPDSPSLSLSSLNTAARSFKLDPQSTRCHLLGSRTWNAKPK